MVLFLLIIFANICLKVYGERKPPHIILILADDWGWNDAGFHGSNEIPTPNIDALSYNGIAFTSHYSEALCTPSRASLLTGKYPIHTGMQHGVIIEPEPWGLPLEEKILPQYLEKLGYESHAVGKWHLGFYKEDYTPLNRGFKSHYGFWNGYQDYYNHTVQASFVPYEGYDMRRGKEIDWSSIGKYSTDLYTDESVSIIMNHNSSKPLFLYLAHLAPHAGNYEDPLQAPDDILEKLSNIPDHNRRKYAGMVVKLDESLGRIMTALRESNILQNTVIVFLSDNGGATEGLHANGGSNWPLKGNGEIFRWRRPSSSVPYPEYPYYPEYSKGLKMMDVSIERSLHFWKNEKFTPWEGGIHTTAFSWSPLFKGKRVVDGLFHISDWLPTLYSLAGGNISDLGEIDGVNQKEMLLSDLPSKRQMILHNIDEITGYEALRINDYKYVDGTVLLGYLDKWHSGDAKQNYHRKQYNITAILHSEVSVNLLKTGFILPSFDEIVSLRNQSIVACGKQKFMECKPFERPCLFNIKRDPCEIHNMYEETALSFIKIFENVLEMYKKTALKPRNKPADMNADPKLYNNTWVNWGDYNVGYDD